MNTNYDDRQQDLEGTYRSPYSSAGRETQLLSAPYASGTETAASATPPPAVATHRSRNNAVALALIGVGVLMLMSRLGLAQLELTGGFVLLTIASCFLFFAFWQRIYGLSIPGFILAGLSVGVTFAYVTGGVSVLWGLSLGFLMVYVVGNLLFGVRSSWPIIPSVILFAVGCIAAVSQLPSFFAAGFLLLPLLLVSAGLYLGWGRRPI